MKACSVPGGEEGDPSQPTEEGEGEKEFRPGRKWKKRDHVAKQKKKQRKK